MSKKTYSVVVLGAGKRGKMHAKLFSQNERFRLAGLCDIDPERLKAASADCGNPPLFSDAKVMLDTVKPDIFCFCTPPALRKDIFKMGVKTACQFLSEEKLYKIVKKKLILSKNYNNIYYLLADG